MIITVTLSAGGRFKGANGTIKQYRAVPYLPIADSRHFEADPETDQDSTLDPHPFDFY